MTIAKCITYDERALEAVWYCERKSESCSILCLQVAMQVNLGGVGIDRKGANMVHENSYIEAPVWEVNQF